MKIVYHSLFGSHLQYGTQLWGQGNCVNQNNIQNLQNQALWKITFKHKLINFSSIKILIFLVKLITDYNYNYNYNYLLGLYIRIIYYLLLGLYMYLFIYIYLYVYLFIFYMFYFSLVYFHLRVMWSGLYKVSLQVVYLSTHMIFHCKASHFIFISVYQNLYKSCKRINCLIGFD